MPRTYFPNNDQAYDDWLQNFVSQLNSNLALFGMVAADIEPLVTKQGDFNTSLAALILARNAAQAATADKDTDRRDSEDLLRPIVRRINNHPAMTDGLRRALGLIPDNVVQSATPVTELTPLIFLESHLGSVTVHWGPNPENEGRNGKPAGVKSANIYRKRAGDETYQLLVNVTKSPYIDSITGEGSDYTYVVRYKGTEPDELSYQSVEATVAARGMQAA